MDAGYSARAAARELGTTVPRVLRAIEQIGMRPARSAGGQMRLTARQLERLRSRLGSLPATASAPRVQMQILAALSRSPRGVVSVRALAERAGVSPTAAAKHLEILRDRGLVRETSQWVPEGRARKRTIIALNERAPEWLALAPAVHEVQLPAAPRRAERRVPERLNHLFWNVADSQKDVAASGPVIARRLVEAGDIDGLAWGLTALSAKDWKHAAATRGISSRQRAMAENFAAAAEVAR